MNSHMKYPYTNLQRILHKTLHVAHFYVQTINCIEEIIQHRKNVYRTYTVHTMSRFDILHNLNNYSFHEPRQNVDSQKQFSRPTVCCHY